MLIGSYGYNISPSVWVLWPGQPSWPSQAQFSRQWLKKQHGLYLFQTCSGPILRFQFWGFGPRFPDKWLLSHYYWPNDQILLQMAVCLVLLEQCSVIWGMSSHLYHSSMSPDHPVQSIRPSFHPGQSYDDFISFRGCTTKKWTKEFTEKIDLACWVKEMAWKLMRWCSLAS